MDELDKKLFMDLSSDVEVPSKCKIVIKNSLNNINSKKEKHYSFSKIAAVSCATLLLTTGIVYAGTKVYENIWKEPEKVVGFYSNEVKKEDIISEQDNVMSEAEAKEKLDELLKKFGRESEPIERIELTSNPNNYELVWHIELDNGTNNSNIVEINAQRENSFGVLFQDELNESVHQYRISENEVEQTARELCENLGYSTEKYNKIKILGNMENDIDSYLWHVDFYKEYDGIVNPYETISISFIPKTNAIYQFNIEDIEFANNSVEINQEQAKEIAIEAENKINTGYKIKNTSIKLSIDQMNGDAYKRITDYEQYYNEKHQKNYPNNQIVNYRVNNLIRKMWKVTIEYDLPEKLDLTDNYTILFDRYYTYYIDASTGEIIGGSQHKY